MSSPNHRADVIDLNAARRERNRRNRVPNQQVPAPRRGSDAQTVIINAVLKGGHEEVHRHIGINDSVPLEELRHALDICFDLDREPAPWMFSASTAVTDTVNEQDAIHQHLTRAEDQLFYRYGLWNIHLEVVDSIVRDESTPQAVCIGGFGSMSEAEFDTSVANERLLAMAGNDNVMELVHPEVASVIERSGVYDFVPLLHALGLKKENPAPIDKLHPLPVEEDPKARDAFWCMLLSLACMSDDELTDAVAVSLMSALGYGELDIEDITALCERSMAMVENYGCYGDNARCAVERIDVYRELLRKE